MITRAQFESAHKKAGEMIRNSGIHMTEAELTDGVEVVDFDLNDLEKLLQPINFDEYQVQGILVLIL